MKKNLLTILLLLFPTLTSAEFSDTKNSWYAEHINFVQEEGIVNGFADGTFKPRQTITRAEILKVAMESANIFPAENTSFSCFPDVVESAWYTPYICTAKKMGIANGHQDGNFRPNSPVTVHEAIAFFTRTFAIEITEKGENWHNAYEDFSETKNIFSAHRYNTNTHISRGQVAEIAHHFLLYSQKKNISYASRGCEVQNPSMPSSLTINGKTRTFIEYIPKDYTPNTEYSVIIASHGRTNSNAMVQEYMGLDDSASWQENAQDDFLVFYPAGLPSGNKFSWHQQENLDFIDALLSNIEQEYCINKENIFIAGHSLGGYFTNKLACERGDVFRAMATVGSNPYGGNCNSPVAGMIFHHPNDYLVNFTSGVTAKNNRKNANQCGDAEKNTIQSGYSCNTTTTCRTGNEVIFCDGYNDTYGGDTHSWPKNAGRAFLEYFRSF